MSARTIRRAAERQAAKLASKAQKSAAYAAAPTLNAVPAVEPPAPAVAVSAVEPVPNNHAIRRFIPDVGFPSHAQIVANQVNAQLSTGPKTDAGKQISSKNALKTGLTGRTVLLPTDDITAYEALLAGYTADFNPTTTEERELTQSIVDSHWRIKRILTLEYAIFAKGSREFADEFPDLDPAARSRAILAETYLKYEKSIRNLNTQEARLQRRLVKDVAEIRNLQAERLQCEAATKAFLAARAKNAPPPATEPTEPKIGFEFEKREHDLALYEPASPELANSNQA